VEDIPGLEVVPLDWCVEAMDRGFERVRAAGWNDPVGAYAAVAETLFWIDVVDEQLRQKHRRHYEATLAGQRDDLRQMLSGLLFARNRITHEVDEVGYILAVAKRADTFAASWTWQSLPPRPGGDQAVLHQHYQETIAGRDVVKTLLAVTIFLGTTRNRMWQRYGQEQPDSPDNPPE
jgi:hypothetical protein